MNNIRQELKNEIKIYLNRVNYYKVIIGKISHVSNKNIF